MPIKVGMPSIIRVFQFEQDLRPQKLVPRMRIRIVLFVFLATNACSTPPYPTDTILPEAEPTTEHEAEHTLEPELEPEFELKPETKPGTTIEPELKPEPKLEPEPELKPESDPETTFETESESGSRLGREPHSLSANLAWLQKRVHQLLRKIKLC